MRNSENEEKPDQNDSVHMVEQAGIKKKHRYAKDKRLQEREEPHVFTIDESDRSDFLRNQREGSEVESTPPVRVSSRKRSISKHLEKDYIVERPKKRNMTSITGLEVSDDSKDTKNRKKKIGPSKLGKMQALIEKVKQRMTEQQKKIWDEIVETEDSDRKMLLIDDILLLQKHLICLFLDDENDQNRWLGDEVRCFAN